MGRLTRPGSTPVVPPARIPRCRILCLHWLGAPWVRGVVLLCALTQARRLQGMTLPASPQAWGLQRERTERREQLA